MPEKVINIHWYASKETIAGFTLEAFNHEFALDPEFMKEFRKLKGGFWIDGFLYDLGHHGRGYYGFPTEWQLKISNLKHLQTIMPLPNFYNPLANTIEEFLGTIGDPGLVEAGLSQAQTLRKLSDQGKNRLIHVTLEPFYSRRYKICSLIGEGYRYPVP